MPLSTWQKNPDCTFCDASGNYMGTENLCPCGKRVPNVRYVVVDEHTLGAMRPEYGIFQMQILHASVLRGSPWGRLD